jgi:hypothetical protein
VPYAIGSCRCEKRHRHIAQRQNKHQGGSSLQQK